MLQLKKTWGIETNDSGNIHSQMIIHNRTKLHKKILAIHNSYWCHLKAWVSGYISITAYVDITLTNKTMIAGQLLGLMCFSRPIMFITCK